MAHLRNAARLASRWALAAAAAASLLAAGDFWWFVRRAEAPLPPPPHADGIVVLTGGAERVETGFRLLAGGQARLLLVSGVARGSELPELARMAGLAPGPMSGRIELGHTADSTVGNARETREWVLRNDIRSLIVVTAGYHMPRALTELRRVLPEVALYPVPVRPPALRRGPDLATLRLLAEEYAKYLVARVGLSRFMPAGIHGDGARLLTRLHPGLSPA